MLKTLSGTTEEIIQQLADEVSELSIRVTDNEDKAIASDAVIEMLLGVLTTSGKLDQASWDHTLETVARRYDSPSIQLDQESSERLHNVAAALRRYKVNPGGSGSKPRHPLFDVIKGGKD